MLTEILLIFVISLSTYIFYSYFQIDHEYFKRRNLKFTAQTFELFDVVYALFQGTTETDLSQQLYDEFPNEA